MSSKAFALAALVVSCSIACSGKEAPASGTGTAAAGASGSGANAETAGTSSSNGGSTTNGVGGNGGGNGGSALNAGSSFGGVDTSSSAGASGASGAGGGESPPGLPKRFLLYSFSTANIPTVPAQLTFLQSTLETWGYEVEVSSLPGDINSANLARFGGVGMINTCFEPFGKGSMGETQTPVLQRFVEDGGGLFGTHCAAVTFQAAEPPNPYNDVIGGRGGHGFYDGFSACRTTAEQHVTTQLLPATFDFFGNLDNADYVASDTKVLVRCQWSGGDMKDTAVSWYRTPGKGRVFYTNFAKLDTDLTDATIGAKHIVLGLGWVLGR